MRDRTERSQDVAERTVKDIRRKTRKRYSAEEKILYYGFFRSGPVSLTMPYQSI